MEGEFHFDATPIAPPGSEMLMHEKPNRRRTWGFNAKKAWYLGPCFQHYRSCRGILPSTGGERISDTVKFRHHAMSISSLTPADRILEAAKQLDAAIKQQPKKAPMDEITAIELLRQVVLGETKEPLPLNSLQKRKAAQEIAAKVPPHEQTSPPVEELASPLQTDDSPADKAEPADNAGPAFISQEE